jgi:hypothetical protein
LALPAANVPAIIVASTTLHLGKPPAARIIVGRVVTSSNSMMRGLVSATYALSRDVRGAGRAIGLGDRVVGTVFGAVATEVCVTGSGYPPLGRPEHPLPAPTVTRRRRSLTRANRPRVHRVTTLDVG